MTLGLRARSLTLLVASTLPGKSQKVSKLIARAPDLADQFVRQRAVGGSGEDGVEVAG